MGSKDAASQKERLLVHVGRNGNLGMRFVFIEPGGPEFSSIEVQCMGGFYVNGAIHPGALEGFAIFGIDLLASVTYPFGRPIFLVKLFLEVGAKEEPGFYTSSIPESPLRL